MGGSNIWFAWLEGQFSSEWSNFFGKRLIICHTIRKWGTIWQILIIIHLFPPLPKAVRLHLPVLLDSWRSVELAEIPVGIFTVGALTALPDHLLILFIISLFWRSAGIKVGNHPASLLRKRILTFHDLKYFFFLI